MEVTFNLSRGASQGAVAPSAHRAEIANPKLLLVDDHELVRLGVKTLYTDLQGVPITWHEATSLREAIDLYAREPDFDAVLLDLNLADCKGLQGLRQFLHAHPKARVAVFSGTQDEFVVRQARALGAVGYVGKGAMMAEMRETLSALVWPQGGPETRGPAPASTLFPRFPSSAMYDRVAELGPRHLEILELVLSGCANQEISNSIGLSLGTVKNYVSSLLLALDVKSRSHLISLFRWKRAVRVELLAPAAPPRVPVQDAAEPTVAPPAASTFVAVGGRGELAEAEPDAGTEGRLPGRHLHDAALDLVIAASPVWMTVALTALGVAGAALLQPRVGWAWAALLASGALGLAALLAFLAARARVLARRLRWLNGTLGAAATAALLVSPWTLPSGNTTALPWMFAALTSIVALCAAVAFAPWPRLGWLATLLPLSPAAAALHAGLPDAALLGVAGLFGLLAVALMLRWRRAVSAAQARALRERDDRIRTLMEERDAALRADQEKSRFLTIASHDLRQPVHALGLFAATLDKRLQGSPDEHLVRNMIRSIDGLDRSFNAMLDISRLDAGTIEPNVQHFPLRDLFRRLHMHFAGQAELRGLGLRFSPGGKAVSSDPQLLERILGNLVQNAIKYTEHGGIVVVARTTRTRINVEVWDTGIGIGAAELPRVFDEFYQVGRGERARSRGLGMGLAIVKRLARLLGHELTVVSRPGTGTLFRIGIALSDLPEIQDATAAADTLPMPLAQSRTVLIIDDGEAIREGLRLLLGEWGYDAIAAGSLAEAERAVIALEAPPDLILSDLHLGDGPDGLAAIDAVRRQCGHDVAAVVITGDTSHAEMQRVAESGLPVLLKPVQPRKLHNVLRGLLT